MRGSRNRASSGDNSDSRQEVPQEIVVDLQRVGVRPLGDAIAGVLRTVDLLAGGNLHS